MNRWTVAVSLANPSQDPSAKNILRDVTHIGQYAKNANIRLGIERMYHLSGDLNHDQVESIAKEILADQVVDRYEIFEDGSQPNPGSVEIAFNPGVTDPVASSVIKAVVDLGIDGLGMVKTGHRYIFSGDISNADLDNIAKRLLMNPVVQHRVMPGETPSAPELSSETEVIYLELLDAEKEKLMEISRNGGLSLNLKEMETIKGHFAGLGRNPTEIELETIAQTWSEHCVHKTFKGKIEYEGEVIDNLLKSTIALATHELDVDWCVSVFVDNAGIVKFDDEHHIAFKVETHNHPSAVEPYGGAGTGIGGVIRDILGTGLGAKPVANTNIFCFAPPETDPETLPEGVLHPRQVFRGVVAGVSDYGNRMGIPTVNGAVLFDEGYLGNPLVYCGTVGIMPVGTESKEVKPGHVIVLVGGKTGRDGIHGATLSSADLDSEVETAWSTAVQIGNPITEKKMMDVLMVARDRRLYESITDCGAGGLSSAVGEMGAECGVCVELEKVPLKYEGLTHTEIWISEAQERMVLSVPPKNVDELLTLFASEDVEATAIGEFTDTGRLILRYGDTQVGELSMEFLHDGVPQLVRKAIWSPPSSTESAIEQPEELTQTLIDLLGCLNIASKEWVIRQYDHEVQGGSVLKPLVGEKNDGPSDAAVIRPVLSSTKGVAISNGINPRYGLVDPYHMALCAIDEALRQIVAVGGRRDKTSLLDNFCWGNPEVPERLGELVRAAKGCYDGSKAFGTPFISGKDSFYNEFKSDGKSISIPATLLISAMAVIDDVRKVISMDFKEPGNLIYIVGDTKDEMGGSHYFMLHGEVGTKAPSVNLTTAPKVMDAVTDAIGSGHVRACHDLSEGGLGVTLAEMAFAGEVGAAINLKSVPQSVNIDRDDTTLFSESPTRFVLEVDGGHRGEFEACFTGLPFGLIGETTSDTCLHIYGTRETLVVNADIFALKEAWQAPLREV